MTYKGFKDYMPMVGHLAENGLVIGDEFREGNVAPAARNLEFIKHCIKQMPKGKQIKYLRADSAAYQADIMNFCEKEGLQFAISADLDQSVLQAIEKIPQGDWKEHKNSHIAETVHYMNKTKNAFRLIVILRPYQRNLFTEEDPGIKHIAISTNRTESAEYVEGCYNQRGEHSENKIKDRCVRKPD